MEILSIAFTLFLLIDAVGNIPFFVTILKDIKPARQRVIIMRELFIALGVMLFFNFLGDAVLSALHISRYSVLISGGIILFILSLKMVFPSKHDTEVEKSVEKEPLVVPLAIPLVAGPAVLAAIVLYAGQVSSGWISCSAIVLAWAASVPILVGSSYVKKILGARGIIAIERLFGLIVTMLSIQMLLSGITEYVRALASA
ncbi:MAG: hypothetical protein JSR58_06520 [Verrucomicrobia bacterium]|nr:hypothetical protein [Verrucomicrobiota bacterium]